MKNFLCSIIHQDVFILDTKDEVFVWIGKQTSTNERRNAMTYAHVRHTDDRRYYVDTRTEKALSYLRSKIPIKFYTRNEK